MGVMMNGKENPVIHVMGYIHLVKDIVVVFPPGIFDLSAQDDVDTLVGFADSSGADALWSPIYGDDTIVFLDKDPDGDGYLVSEGDFGCLPEACQDAVNEVRKKIDESGSGTGN